MNESFFLYEIKILNFMLRKIKL